MIDKQITVTFDYKVDEGTKIGVCNGQFVKFNVENDAEGNEIIADSYEPVDACAVADIYIGLGARIPDEFAAARECIQGKINALQAIL